MASLMDEVQIEQKSYEMPPPEGFTVAHLFGGRVLRRCDSKGASGRIQVSNTWLIVKVGAGPLRTRSR